jgi:hypothetical protein
MQKSFFKSTFNYLFELITKYTAFVFKMRIFRELQLENLSFNFLFLFFNLVLTYLLLRSGTFLFCYLFIWNLIPFSSYFFDFHPISFDAYMITLAIVITFYSIILLLKFPKQFQLTLYIFHSLSLSNLENLIKSYRNVPLQLVEYIIIIIFVFILLVFPEKGIWINWFLTIALEIYCLYTLRQIKTYIFLPKFLKKFDDFGLLLYKYMNLRNINNKLDENEMETKKIIHYSKQNLMDDESGITGEDDIDAGLDFNDLLYAKDPVSENFSQYFISKTEYEEILNEYTYIPLNIVEIENVLDDSSWIDWYWLNFCYKVLPIICFFNIIICVSLLGFGIPKHWSEDYEFINDHFSNMIDYYSKKYKFYDSYTERKIFNTANDGTIIYNNKLLQQKSKPSFFFKSWHWIIGGVFTYNFLTKYSGRFFGYDVVSKSQYRKFRRYYKYVYYILAETSRRLKIYDLLFPGYAYWMQIKNFNEHSRLYPENLRETFISRYLVYTDFFLYSELKNYYDKKNFFSFFSKKKNSIWLFRKLKKWKKDYFFAAPAVNVYPDKYYKWLDLIKFVFVLLELNIEITMSSLFRFVFFNEHNKLREELGPYSIPEIFFFYKSKQLQEEQMGEQNFYNKRRHLIQMLTNKTIRKSKFDFIKYSSNRKHIKNYLEQLQFDHRFSFFHFHQPYVWYRLMQTEQTKNIANRLSFNTSYQLYRQFYVREQFRNMFMPYYMNFIADGYTTGLEENDQLPVFIKKYFYVMPQRYLKMENKFFKSTLETTRNLFPDYRYLPIWHFFVRPQYNYLLHDTDVFDSANRIEMDFFTERLNEFGICDPLFHPAELELIHYFLELYGSSNIYKYFPPLFFSSSTSINISANDFMAIMEHNAPNGGYRYGTTDQLLFDYSLVQANPFQRFANEEVISNYLWFHGKKKKHDIKFFKNIIKFHPDSLIGYAPKRKRSIFFERYFDRFFSFYGDSEVDFPSANLVDYASPITEVRDYYEDNYATAFAPQMNDRNVLSSYFHDTNISILPELIDSRIGNQLKKQMLLNYLNRDDPTNRFIKRRSLPDTEMMQFFSYLSTWANKKGLYDIAEIFDNDFSSHKLNETEMAYKFFQAFPLAPAISGTETIQEVQSVFIRNWFDRNYPSKNFSNFSDKTKLEETNAYTSIDNIIKMNKQSLWYRYYYQYEFLMNYYDHMPSYRKFYIETWPKEYLFYEPLDFYQKFPQLPQSDLTPIFADGWLLYVPEVYRINYDITKIKIFYEKLNEDFPDPLILLLF